MRAKPTPTMREIVADAMARARALSIGTVVQRPGGGLCEWDGSCWRVVGRVAMGPHA